VTAPAKSPAAASALRDALEQLVARRLPREAFAAEALPLIARALGVEAAALVGCDAKRTRVFALASVGLAPKLLEQLLSPSGRWLALRSLNEHRITVFGSAHENPFVPKTIIGALGPQSLAIASIPFFHGSTPVGTLVLFSPHPGRFTDHALGALSQALRACAAMLAEPAPPAGTALPVPPPGAAPAAPPAAPEAAGADAAELARAQRLLQEERRRAARLERDLGDLRTSHTSELQRLGRQTLEAQVAAAQARAQTAGLRKALAEAESRARASAELVDGLAAARDQSQAAIDALRAAGEGPIPLDSDVRNFLFRLTDSITGLLTKAMGVAPPGSAAAAAPPTPATVPTPLDTESAVATLQHAAAQLKRTLAQLEQQGGVLVELRDTLHAWRIRRSEGGDGGSADPLELEASGDTWLLGDILDEMIDGLDELRSEVAEVTQRLDERFGGG
jgi:hypothetical protein